MIIIQGKNEKSKHVENLIRKEFMTNKLVIIDAVGYKAWSEGEWATIWEINGITDYKELIKSFEEGIEVFNNFDWVVFYVNSDEESIAAFKELDRTYPQNFIVTIQTNAGLTNKYFI
jgi:hypothetical protein